ncbi:hypothetical protein M758_1G102100 [Ceratodon purpureus]|nr:hypothetical protein M758_1G102100 [Ceratodon purpureus]
MRSSALHRVPLQLLSEIHARYIYLEEFLGTLCRQLLEDYLIHLENYLEARLAPCLLLKTLLLCVHIPSDFGNLSCLDFQIRTLFLAMVFLLLRSNCIQHDLRMSELAICSETL